MPTDKKRVNLSVPDKVYEQLQEYKKENGIENDATACLQLVVQQLNSYENMKQIKRLFSTISPEQLKQLSDEGLQFIGEHKEELNV